MRVQSPAMLWGGGGWEEMRDLHR